MKITRAEVEHVADLARLHFTQEELEGFTTQLNDILSYVAQLEELDAGGIEPSTHAIHMANAFRKDEIKPSLPPEEALANAPEKEDDAFFVVPKII